MKIDLTWFDLTQEDDDWFFFHIQIIPHFGISERGRTIEQCTEENNFPIAYVINLDVFTVNFFTYKSSNWKLYQPIEILNQFDQ